jgi:DNA-binding NtrC family response regulator
MNILVVEDDADLRVEIVEYLQRRRHTVTGCGSVAAARLVLAEMVRTSPPDAAICDVGLPDGDGVRFYLEGAPSAPNCHWILMSGAHDLDRLSRVLKGVVSLPTVLEKPLPLRALGSALEGAGKPAS